MKTPLHSWKSTERFAAKIRKDANGCWIWTAHRDDSGYGVVGIGGKLHKSHRVSYYWLVGPIPFGLQIDHLCRNRACCNPEHLEPVTQQENIRRGEGGRNSREKTHCPQGHPYDAENTFHSKLQRVCRKCRLASNRACRARKKAARG